MKCLFHSIILTHYWTLSPVAYDLFATCIWDRQMGWGTHSNILHRNIWLVSLIMASSPFMETFLRLFSFAGNFQWRKFAVSTPCSISRLGAQILILQCIFLKLAIVNNSLKNAQRRRKVAKEKIKSLKFFFCSLMNKKHIRACVNTNAYGQFLSVTAFFIISVIFS